MNRSGSDRPRRLRVSKELRGFIHHLHPDLKRKVRSALKEILRNPCVGKPLKEELSGLRSFRVGRIRIIYRDSAAHVDLRNDHDPAR